MQALVKSAQTKHQTIDWALAPQQQAEHLLIAQLQHELSIVSATITATKQL